MTLRVLKRQGLRHSPELERVMQHVAAEVSQPRLWIVGVAVHKVAQARPILASALLPVHH